ncbi:DMT family transporter [Roseivirga sp. UBA838]|jgi:drug/metabolite transporter (DMT)-like permease|uniref:DMT family transporter n=1 Tax=Roseivirga sp. UBA838 TaxID=1947393 RepID=UPI00257A5154|nr:DMT family transporter [Roseivirga sp. UBA838]|tara:strand:- start:14569 stop:15429 length:861 start_codon:yes stop_codon:yes gene_type:complete
MFSKGVIYMMLATFVFAVMNVLVKYLPNIPAIEIILFRSIVSFFMSGVTLRIKKVPLLGNNRKVLLIRGLAGALALMMFFTTLQEIPLASAVTLMFLGPIFTTLIGIWVVGEKVSPIQWLFFALSFAGIVMIKGFDPRVSPFMALLGVGAAFFSGVAYNMIRKLKTSEHPLVIIFYFPLVTLPIVGVYSALHWVQPEGIEWLLLLGVGVLTQIAQYFLTVAYQSEELSKVSNINFIGIIYALGFGFFLFDETFNVLTYLGMTAVMAGVVLNVIFKSKKKSHEAVPN